MCSMARHSRTAPALAVLVAGLCAGLAPAQTPEVVATYTQLRADPKVRFNFTFTRTSNLAKAAKMAANTTRVDEERNAHGHNVGVLNWVVQPGELGTAALGRQ